MSTIYFFWLFCCYFCSTATASIVRHQFPAHLAAFVIHGSAIRRVTSVKMSYTTSGRRMRTYLLELLQSYHQNNILFFIFVSYSRIETFCFSFAFYCLINMCWMRKKYRIAQHRINHFLLLIVGEAELVRVEDLFLPIASLWIFQHFCSSFGNRECICKRVLVFIANYSIYIYKEKNDARVKNNV